MPVLRVESLSKSYAQRSILQSLLGPSGSGKTTLLNCVGGVDHADSGEIHVANVEMSRLDEQALAQLRRRSIGHVFQFFHLLPTLTAAENVELPLQLLHVPTAQRQQRVHSLLERVGVEHRADALPGQLSGGETRRSAPASTYSGG
jgi:ABC-type lipoprotein export system ATPase subunit